MDYQTPDSQINFRLHSALKASFIELCRANQITVSEALVTYMQRCVDSNEMLDNFTVEKRLVDVESLLINVCSRLAKLEGK
ncbi:hypothetical protein [Kamptonema sp. UHCC 0994]|uniref:hypothetical protein n=1 Tax=Kamptonema sp. UHCC 0994 TaxID=3031329 RepID=UPI0023B9E122|nr:hypothetical protein [Kamptonema sp. UHCC 0994]MDF0554920.1 hypothetical protein [Kamptonema sp. UHCC 0994]